MRMYMLKCCPLLSLLYAYKGYAYKKKNVYQKEKFILTVYLIKDVSICIKVNQKKSNYIDRFSNCLATAFFQLAFPTYY